MSVPQSDVLITGGSIAGCIAALSYARSGLHVTVVEKKMDHTGSYKRLCTHFIQPSALPVLKALELDKKIERAGGLPNKPDIWTGVGWIRSDRPYTNDPDLAHGYNIERRILDPLLRQTVLDHPLITMRHGLQLEKVLTTDGRDVCTDEQRLAGLAFMDHVGQAVELDGRLIVAADGRFSTMAELLSNGGDIHPNRRFACFAYFEDVPLVSKDHSQFWMVDGNMAFAYPLAENRALICLFITKKDWPEWKEDLEGKYLSFIRGLEDAPPVDGGRRVSTIYRMLDMPNILRKPVVNGVAFVGDAAMALDPMSGVGCGFAIQTASWLAAHTCGPLKDGLSLDDALQQYALYHQEQLLPHAVGICADSLAEPVSDSRRQFFREICSDPGLSESFLALTGRIITPKKFQSAYFQRRLLKKVQP